MAVAAVTHRGINVAGMTPNPMFGAEMAHVSREQRRQIAEVVKAAGIALVD